MADDFKETYGGIPVRTRFLFYTIKHLRIVITFSNFSDNISSPGNIRFDRIPSRNLLGWLG